MVAAVPGVVTRNPSAVEKHVRRRPIEHVVTRRTSRPPTEIKQSIRLLIIFSYYLTIFFFLSSFNNKKSYNFQTIPRNGYLIN